MLLFRKTVVLLLVLSPFAFAEEDFKTYDTQRLYESKDFALGVDVSLVRFDTNIKSSSKNSDRAIFFDVEGNFDLPEISTVYSIFGAYRFNDNHGLLLNYFSVKRSSNTLSIDESYGDVISVKADVNVEDRSKFLNLSYGYSFFHSNSGSVTFVAGLNAMNLAYKVEMQGELIIDGHRAPEKILFDENLFVPLPLVGLNFRYNYTKDFAVATNVSFVAGAYKNVKAGILQTSVNALYNVSDHVGLLLGLTYFDANIEIEKETLEHKVVYGYKGATAGVYFTF